ncbi:hypothetical protein EYZ11_013041 [Aspergillus tanneri]|uniref:Uncharacterized protein n=1 Tax=Aspergillus tanneri TaxID=1220188 RepID=A0A4S3IYR4_9EURO|nr:uncharacterized protein ATNIH1004_007256 [Aspergillus tanneri]KAA8645835.1 hypothetical protein ATNIH1004_007256 [Aspergillus tanneri]THC87513.1 hypothetical protein EYZ11_013041 [Aspergillus tanneri]
MRCSWHRATLSADKKFFSCCLAGQRLVGSPDTAFDCCAAGHDLAGSADVGFRCCPTGYSFDGQLCKQLCQNGKQLVNGKCVCPDGQVEGLDGECETLTCDSGLQTGKCYTFKSEQGYTLGVHRNGNFWAAPDSIDNRWSKLQLCKDQACIPGLAVNPSDGIFIVTCTVTSAPALMAVGG